jgi:hypothetical protein
VGVKQSSYHIDDKQLFILRTCETYQKEKESISLSSRLRPKQENTLHFSFRQTCFPDLLNDDEKETDPN